MATPFDLRELEYFVAAAEELNFTRAAERVFVTQSALSQKIAQMEGKLGVGLFERSPRGVALTDAGDVLLGGARDLLAAARDLADRTRRAVQEGDGGVRLGYVEYAVQMIVSSLVAALLRRHPSARVSNIEMPSFDQARALKEGRIDVGFGMRPIVGKGVATKTIVEGTWLAVMPETHRLAPEREIAVEALSAERLLLFARSLNHRVYDRVVDSFRRAGFEPHIVYETVQAEVGPRLVAEGVGVFVIASYALRDVTPGLVARPVRGMAIQPTLAVAWRRGDDSPLVRTLVEAAVSYGGCR